MNFPNRELFWFRSVDALPAIWRITDQVLIGTEVCQEKLPPQEVKKTPEIMNSMKLVILLHLIVLVNSHQR